MKIEDQLDPKIINFLKNDNFLKFPFNQKLVSINCKIIYDASKADDIFSYTLDDDEIKIYQEWDAVRANQITEMKTKYGKDNYEVVMNIFKFLVKILDGKDLENESILDNIPYFMDSLIGDFTQIIFNDYAGLNNSFFHNILEVYLAGGWPCGWNGEYPEGRLVVFSNE